MISFVSNASKFGITIQADVHGVNEVSAFSLSRTMLRVVRVVTPLQLSVVKLVASYSGGDLVEIGGLYTDPVGVLELPLRNLVNRGLDNGDTRFNLTVYMREVNSSAYFDTLAISVYLFKGISYLEMLAPAKKNFDEHSAGHQPYIIVPPVVMYNPTATNAMSTAKGTIAESNVQEFDKDSAWSQGVSGIYSTITPTGTRNNQLEILNTAETLKYANLTIEKVWQLQKTDFCSDWVVVRWTSLTGAVRQHWFPIVAFINGIDKEISIVEAGNGYDVRKNAYKGVKCRITGLTPYDCWYYQDLLQASDAHAVVYSTLAIWSTEIANMETAVYAEGGMDTTPEGNSFYNFEFSLKLRHYDTF